MKTGNQADTQRMGKFNFPSRRSLLFTLVQKGEGQRVAAAGSPYPVL